MTSTARAFVGRERELAEGQAVLDEMLEAHGRLLLVAGEPGMGKSRLAEELANRARAGGVRAVWGRCWEAGGAPAYWPWLQSLRSLFRDLDEPALQASLGDGAAEIAQLIPDVRRVVVDEREPAARDPDAARFSFFDAVTTSLKNLAASGPVMLVLDDLQVADAPSLLLLRFIAGALGDDRILLVGTYRDDERPVDHPLATALAELIRSRSTRLITLRGLAPAEVADFIRVTAGFAADEQLATVVYDKTEGNPLFVQEVTRLLLEEGTLAPHGSGAPAVVHLPRSVRDVIRRRLAPLSTASLEVLSLACVMGREFSVAALARVREQSLSEVLGSLEESRLAGVVAEAPGSRDVWRFAHVLIRDSLYEDIPRATRMQLHRKVAGALESKFEGDLEPRLAELAHHLVEAASSDDLEKAVAYARAAGDHALDVLAYEEAVRLYRLALDAAGTSGIRNTEWRCDLLLALGDAQARAGDEASSKRTFLEAAALAETLGLRELQAKAALGYGGRLVWIRAGSDARLIPLLEDGLRAVGEADSVLRTRLLARLSGAMRDDPSPEPRESIAREAVAMARRSGDPAALAYALDGLYAALWKPDNPEERSRIAAEMVAVSERAGDLERVVAGHRCRYFAFMELGDREAVYSEIDAMERMAGELHQAAGTWWAMVGRAIMALTEGRLDEAQRLVDSSLQLGLRATRSDAAAAHRLHLFQIRREQGRLEEMEEVIRASVQEYPWYPMFRCALALLHCELGGHAQARLELDGLSAHGFTRIPFDNMWLFSLSMLSEVIWQLADVQGARALYLILLPYAERIAFGAEAGCSGSVSRYLGLLAATSARTDDAVRHLEAGIAASIRMHAPGWVAQAQFDLATLLLERGGSGDRDRAAQLLDEAEATCRELGMPALAAKIAALRTRESVAAPTLRSAPSPGDVVVPGASGGALRLEGEYWSVSYADKVTRLRDSKGMRVLAELLMTPGRPHPALDLERLGARGDDATVRAAAAGSAGELLDDTARREYRVRLGELDEDIEAAQRLGKAAEAGALREEKHFITGELRRALGLGGRARVAGSTAERARLNVTRAVRTALRHIAAANPALAEHLEATVRTGTVCIYTPDPRSPISWRVARDPVHRG